MVIIKDENFDIDCMYNSRALLSDNFIGVIYDKFCKIYLNNKKQHRYYGPAFISENYKEWWFNDECYGGSYEKYNQKQFRRQLIKQWLS